MIYTVGAFEIDLDREELRCRGREIRLQSKVFKVLAHLIEHRNRFVSKDELLEQVWAREVVTESSVRRCVREVRRAFDVADLKVIETVRGRGYRFVAPLKHAHTGSEGAFREGSAIHRYPAELPLVGRDQTLRALRVGLEEALAGRGQLLLLTGEAGIGKTRMTREFGVEAGQRQAKVLTGRCHEGKDAPAYWPLVQALREHVSSLAPSQLERELERSAGDIAQLLPELRDRCPSRVTAPVVEPELARFQLFDGVTAFIKDASLDQPWLLVLDDLHWADQSTLLLLRFLVRSIRDSCVLIVGTYREAEVESEQELSRTVAELLSETNCHALPLRGLGQAEVAALLEGVVGRSVPDSFVTVVYEMTQGNPFFIDEILRLLVTDDRLQIPADINSWRVELPKGVRAVIKRRLIKLSNRCRNLLTHAAVIGRSFDLNLLERLTDCPVEDLLKILDEAITTVVLTRDQDAVGSYCFSHGLIRQALYEELDASQSVVLHRKTGEALEKIHAEDPTPQLTALAHHFFLAAPGGDIEKALDYAVRAASWATSIYAHEESVFQFERALQLLALQKRIDEAKRCEIMLALAVAYSILGYRDRNEETCRQAAEIARNLVRPDLLARAAIAFGGHAIALVPSEERRSLLEEALSKVGNGHTDLRAQLLIRLMATPPYERTVEKSRTLSHEALQLARKSDDPLVMFQALYARLQSLLGPDRDAEEANILAELDVQAQQSENRLVQLMVCGHRLGICLTYGEITKADSEAKHYQQLAEELRQPAYLLYSLWARVGRGIADGRFTEAQQLIQESFSFATKMQFPGTTEVLAWHSYCLLKQTGGLGQLTAWVLPLVEKAVRDYPYQKSVAAWLYHELDHDKEAQELLDSFSPDDLATIPRNERWLTAMAHLAVLCAALGEVERGACTYELLRPYAHLNVCQPNLRTYDGSVSQFLGLLAALLGRPADAARHYEDALQMNQRMGARPYVARTQLDYARFLLASDESQHARTAHQLLQSARATAAELGMAGLLRDIATLGTAGA